MLGSNSISRLVSYLTIPTFNCSLSWRYSNTLKTNKGNRARTCSNDHYAMSQAFCMGNVKESAGCALQHEHTMARLNSILSTRRQPLVFLRRFKNSLVTTYKEVKPAFTRTIIPG